MNLAVDLRPGLAGSIRESGDPRRTTISRPRSCGCASCERRQHAIRIATAPMRRAILQRPAGRPIIGQTNGGTCSGFAPMDLCTCELEGTAMARLDASTHHGQTLELVAKREMPSSSGTSATAGPFFRGLVEPTTGKLRPRFRGGQDRVARGRRLGAGDLEAIQKAGAEGFYIIGATARRPTGGDELRRTRRSRCDVRPGTKRLEPVFDAGAMANVAPRRPSRCAQWRDGLSMQASHEAGRGRSPQAAARAPRARWSVDARPLVVRSWRAILGQSRLRCPAGQLPRLVRARQDVLELRQWPVRRRHHAARPDGLGSLGDRQRVRGSEARRDHGRVLRRLCDVVCCVHPDLYFAASTSRPVERWHDDRFLPAVLAPSEAWCCVSRRENARFNERISPFIPAERSALAPHRHGTTIRASAVRVISAREGSLSAIATACTSSSTGRSHCFGKPRTTGLFAASRVLASTAAPPRALGEVEARAARALSAAGGV